MMVGVTLANVLSTCPSFCLFSGWTLLSGRTDRRIHSGYQQDHKIHDLGKWWLSPGLPLTLLPCLKRKWRKCGMDDETSVPAVSRGYHSYLPALHLILWVCSSGPQSFFASFPKGHRFIADPILSSLGRQLSAHSLLLGPYLCLCLAVFHYL